jgi:hypothetical protein
VKWLLIACDIYLILTNETSYYQIRTLLTLIVRIVLLSDAHNRNFGEILILNIIKQGVRVQRDPDIFPFHGQAIKSLILLAGEATYFLS